MRCGILTDLIITDQFDASLSHVGGAPIFQKGERGSPLKNGKKKKVSKTTSAIFNDNCSWLLKTNKGRGYRKYQLR